MVVSAVEIAQQYSRAVDKAMGSALLELMSPSIRIRVEFAKVLSFILRTKGDDGLSSSDEEDFSSTHWL